MINPRIFRPHGFLVTVGLAVFLAGCADIEVTKIPSPSQYSIWSDADQRKADKIQGFRYYLPRPYIAVEKEFPIGGTYYLVYGKLSADGKTVILVLDELDENDAFITMGADGKDVSLSIKKDILRLIGPTVDTKQLWQKRSDSQSGDVTISKDGTITQGATEQNTGSTPEAKKKPQEPSDKPEAGKKSPQEPGGANAKLTGVARSSPVLEIPGPFNVVYLPDFDEQYAIQPKARLSKVNTAFFLQHGWMLENGSLMIDNTIFGKFILDQIGKTLDLFRNLARPDKGLLAPTEAPDEEKPEAPDVVTQGLTEQNGQEVLPTVLLKINVMHMAVPGLYPIKKPRENGYNKSTNDTSCKKVSSFRPSLYYRLQDALARSAMTNECYSIEPFAPLADISTRDDIKIELISVTKDSDSDDRSGRNGNGEELTNKQLKQYALEALTSVDCELPKRIRDKIKPDNIEVKPVNGDSVIKIMGTGVKWTEETGAVNGEDMKLRAIAVGCLRKHPKIRESGVVPTIDENSN